MTVGVVAVPIMIAIMLVVSGKASARGTRLRPLPRWLKILGWLSAGLMALAVALLGWASVA